MIQIKNLNKEYKLLRGKVQALKDINISFLSTGFYSIIGRSGAGKTTLLNCIAGIDKVTSGEIYYNDVNICKLKGVELDNYRENIAFIFQDYNLLKEYNVEDNIALSIEIQGVPKNQIKCIVNDVLKKVGLEGYNQRRIVELSGGEQQRVVIARALAKKSKIIFCDEPTGNLDEKTARELFKLLKNLSKEFLIINVTHNNILANEFSDNVIEIENGKIIKITPLNNINNNIINNKLEIEKKNKLGFSFVSRLLLEHLKNMKLLSFVMLIIFICSFTILTIFTSVSSFNYSKALISTIKNNNQTILSVVNYKDYIEEQEKNDGKYYDYGVILEPRLKTYEELQKVKEDLVGKATVYNSYYYLKNFDSLFGIKYPYELDSQNCDFIFRYHAFNFNEIIAVDDFSNLNMPLLYGGKPKEENEILIYDYMAENMIYHHAFNCEMNELIGKTICDKSQNLDFRIAGIIKSNYKEYEYTDGLSKRLGLFGQYYLISLKCIFAKDTIINKLTKNINSINGIKIIKVDNENKSINYFERYNKICYLENNNFNFIYKNNNIGFGYILTLSQVSEILGIDRTPSDDELAYFINLCSKKNGYISIINSEYTPENVTSPGYYRENSSPIYGIVSDGQLKDDNAIYLFDEYYYDGMELNKFYINLNLNYSYADEVIEYFSYPSHDERYYEECIKNKNFYSKEGFCIYDNSNTLISEASDYLESIKSTAESAVFLSIILIIVGISGLCLLSIKKQVYKIGILKSLGTKNYQIQLSYVLFVTILAFVGCIISIPTSFIVMNIINESFINTLDGVKLIMFSISNNGIIFTLLSTIIISFITSIIIYIIFTINPPVMLIRENKDR